MRILVFIGILAFAAAQEFHDDVFHFTTLKDKPTIGSRQQVVQQVVQQVQLVKPVYTQQVVARPAVRPIYTQRVVQARPVITEVRAAPVVTQKVVSVPIVQQTTPAFTQQTSGFASGSTNGQVIRILEYVQEVDPSGPYKSKYSTENGISSSEQGALTKGSGPENTPAVAKEGTYSYTGEDGQQYAVNWIADEYGFRASGHHLPTPPPIPAEIQRSLDIIAKSPQKDLQK